MTIQSWVDTLAVSLQNMWLQVAGFLPQLIGAIVILIIGLIVAAGLEKLVERVVYHTKIDSVLRQTGLDAFMQRAGMHLNAGFFLGQLVYWFFIVVFLLAGSEILGFGAFSSFLKDVLNYIPKAIIATFILLVSLVAANFTRGVGRSSVMGARLHAGKTLGMVAWWGIVVFGFMTTLVQLGVAVQVINTLITGLVAMLALAGGLAFGLGGRDMASQWLMHMREEMNHKG